MRKLSADYIFPVSSEPIPNGVIVVDDAGKILSVDHPDDHNPGSVEKHQGVIIPGFINTHCHLELSHMKGLVDTGTGLLPFISNVVTYRDFPQDQILAAIDQADRYMYESGVVAVGDISNKLDTASCKKKSAIRYYTFVEMFDFLQDAAAVSTFEQYQPVYEGQSTENGDQKSYVPHAPYSVSKALFSKIKVLNKGVDHTVSIHNQETPDENELFVSKNGRFP